MPDFPPILTVLEDASGIVQPIVIDKEQLQKFLVLPKVFLAKQKII